MAAPSCSKDDDVVVVESESKDVNPTSESARVLNYPAPPTRTNAKDNDYAGANLCNAIVTRRNDLQLSASTVGSEREAVSINSNKALLAAAAAAVASPEDQQPPRKVSPISRFARKVSVHCRRIRDAVEAVLRGYAWSSEAMLTRTSNPCCDTTVACAWV